MKILAKIEKAPSRYALIHLVDKANGDRIHRLINKGKYKQAILEALKKADSFKEVYEIEKESIRANLILTESSAHWDLTV